MLKITLEKNTEQDALMGFPFELDQYIQEESGNDVIIELAHRDDTTAAQENFLDTNPAVKTYKII